MCHLGKGRTVGFFPILSQTSHHPHHSELHLSNRFVRRHRVGSISNNSNKLPPLNRPATKAPDRRRQPWLPREPVPLAAPNPELTPPQDTRSAPSTMVHSDGNIASVPAPIAKFTSHQIDSPRSYQIDTVNNGSLGSQLLCSSQHRTDSPQRHQFGTFNVMALTERERASQPCPVDPVSIARLGWPSSRRRPPTATPLTAVRQTRIESLSHLYSACSPNYAVAIALGPGQRLRHGEPAFRIIPPSDQPSPVHSTTAMVLEAAAVDEASGIRRRRIVNSQPQPHGGDGARGRGRGRGKVNQTTCPCQPAASTAHVDKTRKPRRAVQINLPPAGSRRLPSIARRRWLSNCDRDEARETRQCL